MRKLLIVVGLLLVHVCPSALAKDEGLLPALEVRLGDGSVRKFGPTDGTFTTFPSGITSWELGGFSLEDGNLLVSPMTMLFSPKVSSIRNGPTITWFIRAVNNQDVPVGMEFLLSVPYVAGPYNSLFLDTYADLWSEGTGGPMSLVNVGLDTLVDGVVRGSIKMPDCSGVSTALGCTYVSGSGPSNPWASMASGDFALRYVFTLGERSGVQAVNSTILSAVPEPQTHLMVLAGLLTIGLATRRRRKTQPLDAWPGTSDR